MLAKHTTPFDRIFTHRLDAASQYLHDKEQTRQFTDTIQGNELTLSQLETLHRRKLSFIGHLHYNIHGRRTARRQPIIFPLFESCLTIMYFILLPSSA